MYLFLTTAETKLVVLKFKVQLRAQKKVNLAKWLTFTESRTNNKLGNPLLQRTIHQVLVPIMAILHKLNL